MNFNKLNTVFSGLLVGFIACLLTFPLAAMEGKDDEDVSSLPLSVPHSGPSFLSRPFEAVEREIQLRYPQHFQDSDKLDAEMVADYRRSWVEFAGKNKDLFSTLHNPTLLPALERLQQNLIQYESTHSDHASIARRFIREIQFHKESEDISPCWFEKLPLRFLCAISTFDPCERDFISHLTDPYPALFFALQEKEAWKSHESAVEMDRGIISKVLGLSSYKYSTLPAEMIQEIRERVEKALPAQMVCSLWGTDKIGVSFIVKAMLDDIFLVGVPFTEVSGHGVPLGSYGFAVHDLFHKSVDHRQFKFIQHVIGQGEKYVRNGGSIQKFLSVFLPPTLAKYRGIMDGLKEIYERLIFTFDDYNSRKAMLGFFWILHEEPNFPSFLYNVRNFDDILRIITEEEGDIDAVSLPAYPCSEDVDSFVASPTSSLSVPVERSSAGVDLRDHFETSPVDGSSEWPDEAIIDWVIKNKKVREARKYELVGYSGDIDEPINKADVVLQTIKRSPRYIDVTLTLRQGDVLTYSFQTLFYNIQATHDALKILNLIGIKTKLPNLTLTDNPRKVAQDFIRKGEEELAGLITHFQRVASVFANENVPGKGSLVQRYAQLYDNLMIELTKEIDKSMSTDGSAVGVMGEDVAAETV